MALNKCKLGNFVEPFNQNCGNPNLTVWDVSGVNRDKEFFEPSKQVGEDTSKYKVVPNEYFACNLMHVGRDEVLPIALNHSGKNKFVSPAYTVFKIRENAEIIKEYFFVLLKSNERDRYFWFHTDSSIRDGMSWEDFCDLEISLPPLSVQKKYANIYNAMLENQRCYERGLEDLKLTIDALLDSFKKKSTRRNVGDLLEEIDERNTDNTYNEVFGVNITKQFMPSVASSKDVHNYKIVRNNQFVYSGMQTGRDECIRIALLDNEDSLIVSPAYSVLQVKNDYVIPEYVQMWFSRSEMDRLGWFLSDASIRSNLDLPRFFEIEIPVPTKEEQSALVSIYQTYTLRRKINERLKEQIKKICPVLIKGSLEEGEQNDL